MPGIIDTNILLYAANRDAEEHAAASRFLHNAATAAEQWFLTEGILYEFLRVATHPRVFSRPLSWREALSFLQPLVQNRNFLILTAEDHHWKLLEDVLAALTHPSGNLFFDVRTAVLMREHGIGKIYTTDTDFLQFAGIKVINPLRL
jgi:toxin-antitoxin system PIN domain toxin